MTNTSIYQDIAERTGGDIYIGEGVIIGQNQKALKTGINDFVQFFYAQNRVNSSTAGGREAMCKIIVVTNPKEM